MRATFPPSRSVFRETLSQVAEQAKALLPEQVNGRIESAVKLVLAGDVFFLEDGTATVGSASDPGKTYTLAGNACDCQDFAYGQAPQGWCQHKIACNLQKSVERVLARRDAPPVVPDLVEPWPDNDVEEEYVPMDQPPPVTPALPPLGEAPASVNVRLTIGGREVQLTLRDVDEEKLLIRLETVLARYPMPQPPVQPPAPAPQLSPQQHNALAMHRPVSGFCAVHNMEMKLNHGKDGRTWYSHYDEAAGRWCKGR